jgi:hypothetical protein
MALRTRGDPDEPHAYTFTHDYNPKHLTPVQILKLCDCYEYQACETGEAYYQSFAHAIIQAIRGKAWRRLPGYDEAEWTI